jgi:hypothetical protein
MTKSSSKAFRNLSSVIENTLEKLMDSVILKINKQYVVFNKYSITRTDTGVDVFRRRDHSITDFDKIKHAMIWIMLDHSNRFYERDRIKALDSMLSSVVVDKKIHENLKTKNKKDIELFLLYRTKLDGDIRKEKRIIAEIDKYYKMANTISHTQGNKK